MKEDAVILEYIKSDLYRYTGEISFKHFYKEFKNNRSFKYTFWFRLTRSKNFFIKKVARSFHRRLSNQYGIQIHKDTQIGYGLYIGHHMSIVINETTKIGNNCNLSQFTTIGANEGQAAYIGDNVYIGPNVNIVEDVKIGNNVTIGAGAVVTKDIIDNMTVAGVPAKVISQKVPGRYINNRWVSE